MPNFNLGDRVIYSINFNSPGQMAPEDKLPGTIIGVCLAGGIPIYRIELDMVWGSRLPEFSQGKKIILGNILGNHRIVHLIE